MNNAYWVKTYQPDLLAAQLSWHATLSSTLLAAIFWLAATAIGEEPSPVAAWDFDSKLTDSIHVIGNVQFGKAGPRPPEYPDLANDNLAIQLDGRGSYLAIADQAVSDTPRAGRFDFGLGDAITIEAWVLPEEITSGKQAYIIGKGRTGDAAFSSDNQNWAMRLVGVGQQARVGFLFAADADGSARSWHRWTSEAGFELDSGWHHIAVAYRFGAPETIRAWVDGVPSGGHWDMAGQTKLPPVVDDDAVWIGSSRGGSISNSYRGYLDSIHLHRELLSDGVIANRFSRIGGPRLAGPPIESMPMLGQLPAGQVAVTIHEGLSSNAQWPSREYTAESAVMRWQQKEFLLPRIPVRYDDWGIRDSWDAPVLLRMAADVTLPPGDLQVMLRARGLARLWINGQAVAQTVADTHKPPDGEEPITPPASPPAPGIRPKGYHQQEVVGNYAQPRGDKQRPARVVLEIIVGGKDRRTETGEVCVAICSVDGERYQLLAPQREDQIGLTDASIRALLAQHQTSLNQLDDRHRRKESASQDDYWMMRHQRARRWAQTQQAADIPHGIHPVDFFVKRKIDQAEAASVDTDPERSRFFHDQVLPILQERCFGCHGEKRKGGLELTSRELALRGGDSGEPALIPGKPMSSQLLQRVTTSDEYAQMPPAEKLSQSEIALLRRWIEQAAPWPTALIDQQEMSPAQLTNDEEFARRIYLDLVGVPPTLPELRDFLESTSPEKRVILIDQLLDQPRCADHEISHWLDILAENPTLINLSLNSTGPFRWFLYDSLRDNKPIDRMVSELLMMRGSAESGGSAGFALAAENDAPFAAKGHIVAASFLAIDLQCARCHDSPYHSTTQRDLFSLAAMLERKPVKVPPTSRVPDEFFEKQQRKSLIQVTLKPNQTVEPNWPFANECGIEDSERLNKLLSNPSDSRERLALLITAAENRRFAEVFVNQTWKRLIGAGIVEPVHDWEGHQPSHPGLLNWLALDFIIHGYDSKHLMRRIVTSQLYQRRAVGQNLRATAQQRYFAAPEPRRLTAEQLVDSLHAVTGRSIDSEELTFVHDGRRPLGKRQTLGKPTRAWMFASLNNERDRPSLALPRAQAVTDLLAAFGWTGSRQRPIYERDQNANVLQPGSVANGTLTSSLTRIAAGSPLADLAVRSQSPEELVDSLFLRLLSRHPTQEEKAAFAAQLEGGFARRLVPANEIQWPSAPDQLPQVTWFNHLRKEATHIQLEVERRVMLGPPADPRLRPAWRMKMEDFIWSLINHREFVWSP